MSKYSICIIDDKLPAANFANVMDDKTLLNQKNIQFLLDNKEVWKDKVLYDFTLKLFKSDEFEISGFLHHSFFLNHIEDYLFSPDIIVFDWDVGSDTNPENNLLDILSKKYCLVAIYTEADKEDEITQIIKKPDFSNYKEDRLFLVKKDEDQSVDRIYQKISEKKDTFSFVIGKKLKKIILQAVDKILIHIGKLSFNQFATVFGSDGGNGKRVIQPSDFTNIVLQKLQYEIDLQSITQLTELLESEKEKIGDDNKVRELWHYRLYHKNNDMIIRKGDILKKNMDSDDLYLVISSDCHLSDFWKKTLGYLCIIPLHQASKDNAELVKRLQYGVDIANYSISSLVNPRQIDFLITLPGLTTENSKYIDYLLNPREISTISIPLNGNDEDTKSRHLNLDNIPNYQKVISVSEPFMSALFQFIQQNFSGFGVPDFCDELKDSIKNNLKELVKNEN